MVAVAVALVLCLTVPALAACVNIYETTEPVEKCVWDSGCWANPATTDGQYWTYVYCTWIWRDENGNICKQTVYRKWESGGCCTP